MSKTVKVSKIPTGSIVALITPMNQDASIDWQSLGKLVDFHAQNHTDAIVSVGTSGESPTLNIDEQIEVIARTTEFAAGRIPVIAGSGANSTTEALELTERATQLGVSACLLVVPYYNKPTQHGLVQHFRAIAERVDVPQILYNVPGRTALDMQNDTIAQLAEIPNIIGVKEASGDVSRVADLRARCGAEFGLYSGDDATTLEFIKAGGDGCISVTANVAPKMMAEMCRAGLDGDLEHAMKLNAQLDDLHTHLFIESNPIPVKWAIHRLGLAETGIRLPLTWLSQQHQPQVEAAMQRAGVLEN